ncbi:hypothetical protein ACN38_g2660 [Penicillium nordicum]|uniref:SMP-30/Gluconolactonase/LRE-like region domain-containing protein n=1 Tax=Penicillium nordicum TaxID=229535 RepID=A0A0M8P6M5_9EURO|nr:hypothetical protein ACN38_g2660 [Penicillium nordicum]
MAHLLSLALTAVSLLSTTFALPSVDVNVLYNFGNGTWAENLAVRANGHILVSRLDTPEVLQLDPTGATEPIVVASWNPTTYKGCLGISETSRDMFYVVTSGFIDDNFVLTSGVNSIWEIDMRGFTVSKKTGEVTSKAIVSKLVDIPTSDYLNGATTLSETLILVADVYNGWVYRVDTRTGAYNIAINDDKMKFDTVPVPVTNLGVNGIKIKDGYLYWTNTAAGTLNRVRTTNQGVAIGKSEVVVSNVPKADDFIFKKNGVAFVAQNQMDELSIFYPESSAAQVVAGSNTSTILAGVTAGAFGRLQHDKDVLYLTTSGAEALPINGSVTVPATLSWIDTTKL